MFFPALYLPPPATTFAPPYCIHAGAPVAACVVAARAPRYAVVMRSGTPAAACEVSGSAEPAVRMRTVERAC